MVESAQHVEVVVINIYFVSVLNLFFLSTNRLSIRLLLRNVTYCVIYAK